MILSLTHLMLLVWKILWTLWRLLRAELHDLRKRSALKTGSSLDRPVIIDRNRSCARCQTYLGRIINRGAPCRACKLRVCKGCREFTNRTDWICVVCNKQMWVNFPSIYNPCIFDMSRNLQLHIHQHIYGTTLNPFNYFDVRLVLFFYI